MAHRTKRAAEPPKRTNQNTARNAFSEDDVALGVPEEDRDLAKAPKRFTAGRPSRRVLDVLTIETADDFAQLRSDLVESGNLSVTREALARQNGVDEKWVFQCEDASKRVPIALLRNPRVDQGFREDLAEMALAAAREVAGDKRSVVNLGRAIERMRRFVQNAPLEKERREALARSLRRFAEHLAGLACDLEEP